MVLGSSNSFSQLWILGLFSKINWTQVVFATAVVLTALSKGKVNISSDQQVAIIATIAVIGDILTWIIRTFFSPSITPVTTTTTTPGTTTTTTTTPTVGPSSNPTPKES